MQLLFSTLVNRHRSTQTLPTPTALSLLATEALLVAVLCIPQRPEDQLALAANVPTSPLQQGRPSQKITLRERLIAGLKARLPSEVDFVDEVVDEVNAGHLPQRLVDETFFWARGRANLRQVWNRQRRPIIYFQPAMIARADRLGIDL